MGPPVHLTEQPPVYLSPPLDDLAIMRASLRSGAHLSARESLSLHLSEIVHLCVSAAALVCREASGSSFHNDGI